MNLKKKVQIEPARMTYPICTGDEGNESRTPKMYFNSKQFEEEILQ
jgi:hypothetical protein